MILEEKKQNFRSKKRVNKIMIGKSDEVRKETKEILREILLDIHKIILYPLVSNA